MGIRTVLRARWLPGSVLVLVAVLVCLRLGWWQWDRTREADGTLQNLAYAILWPAFGASFIYMWWRFIGLEERRDLQDDRELDADLVRLTDAGAAAAMVRTDPPSDENPVHAADSPEDTDADVTERTDRAGIFVGTVEEADEDEDPELAAYNRALAALAEEDRGRAG